MKWRPKIIRLALLFTASALVIVAAVLPFRRTKLELLLDKLAQENPHREQTKVEIRAIGTNALPQLLRMLDVTDSGFGIRLRLLMSKLPWLHIRVKSASSIHQKAEQGFVVLGPIAAPAIPDLLQRAGDKTKCEDDRITAAWCLRSIGPDSIPPMIRALENPDWNYRVMAAFVLGTFANSASNAVPALLTKLRDENTTVRLWSIDSLEKIGAPSEMFVPALCERLADTNRTVCEIAIATLGRQGSNAGSAFPILLEILASGRSIRRDYITNALKQIDSRRAAEVGVK